MDLIDNLHFVKRINDEEEPSKQQILRDLDQAIEDVNLIKAGKLKAIAAKEILDEL